MECLTAEAFNIRDWAKNIKHLAKLSRPIGSLSRVITKAKDSSVYKRNKTSSIYDSENLDFSETSLYTDWVLFENTELHNIKAENRGTHFEYREFQKFLLNAWIQLLITFAFTLKVPFFKLWWFWKKRHLLRRGQNYVN